MRLTTLSVKNFQSYKELDFDYSSLGLTLLAGQMKAGKSTIMDAGCWVLYGVTSKESAADDVRSWFAEPGDVTEGTTRVELPTETLIVTRKRAKSSSKNDLFFVVEGSEDEIRGKNADDTQKLLNERLGVDSELFIAASYLHQFSKADHFFLAKSKDRRETLERIADQTFAISIGEQASEARKTAKRDRDVLNEQKSRLEGKMESANASLESLDHRVQQWQVDVARRIAECEHAVNTWKLDQKTKLASIRTEIQGWEQSRDIREAEAQKQIDAWQLLHDVKITTVENQIVTWDEQKSLRAMKFADQLTVLSKEIVEPEQFATQTSQLRIQLKALDTASEELTVKKTELLGYRHTLKSLQSEYKKLDSLEGTCPTCLGPADNEHSQSRKDSIEAEVGALIEKETALSQVVADLEDAVSNRSKIQDGFQNLIRKEASNKALIDKAESIRAQVIVLQSETNPNLKQLVSLREVVNPLLGLTAQVRSEVNPHLAKLDRIKAETNPYESKLAHIKFEKNPHIQPFHAQQVTLADLYKEYEKVSAAVNKADHRISSLTWLYDKSFELRGKLLETAVKQLEDKTNSILETFFDAELRVRFKLSDADKLDVEIRNEGYTCPFKQLSGGERNLLCRAFGFAYMKAAENKAGVKNEQLMLDEVLNGLDAQMKVKAFSLLQTLQEEYGTILLIDHSEELKQLFTNQFLVSKSGVYSSVTHVESLN